MYLSYRRLLTSLPLVVAAAVVGLVSWPSHLAARSYSFQDNVAHYMKSGLEHLDAGKLHEAAIDFENVVLIRPGHEEGRKHLFDIYLLLGRRALARDVFKGLERDGVLTPDERILFHERLEQEGQAVPPSSSDEPEVAPSSDSDTPIPSAPTDRSASSREGESLSAEKRFERALQLQRRGRKTEAIPLFVTAIQEEPGLLQHDDEGLLAASRRHYERRIRESPDDANLRFLVAYFHEVYSEFARARDMYAEAAERTEDARLARVARARAEAMEDAVQQRQLQEQELDRLSRQQSRAAYLADLAAGVHESARGAQEFFERGRELYRSWDSSRDSNELAEARAWFEGAVFQDEAHQEGLYFLALVCAEQTTEGVQGARGDSIGTLEKLLALDPSDALTEEQLLTAEGLLKSLRSDVQQSQDSSGDLPEDDPPADDSEQEPRYQRRDPVGW